MAADDCIAQLQACRMRVAQLDETGAVAGDVYVSDGFQRVTLTAVYQDGDEISEKNACGASYIDFLDDPSFIRADIEIDFITPDPYLHTILIDGSALLSPAGRGIGWGMAPIGQVGGNGVSIEWWTKRVDAGALSLVHPYAQWACPRVRSLRVGAREFSNTAQHSIVNGQCNENIEWGDGPNNDFDATSDRVFQWIPADTLPDTTCGAPVDPLVS